ncbi:peptidase dimerization domain-containing protein [Vibrio sp. PP-XX7]
MLAQLSLPAESPYLTIVGEPTDMDIALGHKGKTAHRAHCHGEEAHSSRAPLSVNAIYLACELIHELRQLQSRLKQSGAHDEAYDVPFSTVHVGTIEGEKHSTLSRIIASLISRSAICLPIKSRKKLLH